MGSIFGGNTAIERAELKKIKLAMVDFVHPAKIEF